MKAAYIDLSKCFLNAEGSRLPTPLPYASHPPTPPTFSFCRQNSLLWIGDKNQCPLKDMSRPPPCEAFKAYRATLGRRVRNAPVRGVAGQVRRLPSPVAHEDKDTACNAPERPALYPSPGDGSGRVCRELAQESKRTSDNGLSCWLIALQCYLQG